MKALTSIATQLLKQNKQKLERPKASDNNPCKILTFYTNN